MDPEVLAGSLSTYTSPQLIAELKRRSPSSPFDGFSSPYYFLESLRVANVSRVARYGHGDLHAPDAWNPMAWGCAIAGETGELCNLLKKYCRQAPGDPTTGALTGMIADEIADVIIYLDILAAYYGLSLAAVVALKFNKDSKKRGFPERLSFRED